jgi:hypothetical protein
MLLSAYSMSGDEYQALLSIKFNFIVNDWFRPLYRSLADAILKARMRSDT